MFKFNFLRAYFFGTLFFILSTIVPMGSYAQDRMDQITFHTGNNNKGKTQWQTFCGKLVGFNESQVKFQFMVGTGLLLQESKPIHRSRINLIHVGFYTLEECKYESLKNKVDKNGVKNIVAQALFPTPSTVTGINYYPMYIRPTIDKNPVALIYFKSKSIDDQNYLKTQGCYVVSPNDLNTPNEFSHFYGFPIKSYRQDEVDYLSFACIQKDQTTSSHNKTKQINIPRSFFKIFFQYGRLF